MVIDRLPESWIPPHHIQEIRTLMRLRHSLIEERTTHKQRIHAQLFHNGYPHISNVDSMEGRAHLEDMELPAAARKVVDLSLAMIEHINEELAPIEKELRAYARSQAGCKALMMAHYGVGELTNVALLSELGDTRRFSSSKKAVRYPGMDITVHSSDDKRAAGKLSRQGPPTLRWAAFEVAPSRAPAVSGAPSGCLAASWQSRASYSLRAVASRRPPVVMVDRELASNA
jgi:transposase